MKTLKFLALAGIMLFFYANLSNAQGRNPNAINRFPKENGRSMYDVDYWTFLIPCTGEFVWGTVITNCIRKENSSDITFWWNGEVKCFETGNLYVLQGNAHTKYAEPGQVSEVNTSLTLISKCGTKYRLHANMHVNYNQNGDITANHDFENVSCQEGN